jgi:hypothetical protein
MLWSCHCCIACASPSLPEYKRQAQWVFARCLVIQASEMNGQCRIQHTACDTLCSFEDRGADLSKLWFVHVQARVHPGCNPLEAHLAGFCRVWCHLRKPFILSRHGLIVCGPRLFAGHSTALV